MDERDMEEEGKNRKRKGWEMLFFRTVFLTFRHNCNQEFESPK
jgi:hypothetical protein